MGRNPAVSAGDNTLHTGVGGRREATPQMGLEGPRRQVQEGVALSWLDVCGRRGCHYVHAWAMHGQVELESCKVAGRGVKGPGERDQIINSTRSGWYSL